MGITTPKLSILWVSFANIPFVQLPLAATAVAVLVVYVFTSGGGGGDRSFRCSFSFM